MIHFSNPFNNIIIIIILKKILKGRTYSERKMKESPFVYGNADLSQIVGGGSLAETNTNSLEVVRSIMFEISTFSRMDEDSIKEKVMDL